jgi:hypothetical protein
MEGTMLGEDLAAFRAYVAQLFSASAAITDPNLGVSFADMATGAIAGYASGRLTWQRFATEGDALLREALPQGNASVAVPPHALEASGETLATFRRYVTRLFSANIMDVPDTFAEDALNAVIEYADGSVSWPEFVSRADSLLADVPDVP